MIDVFDNPYPHRRYEIVIQCVEFTVICPLTKQPDFAKIHINYVPGGKCVELKSLKLYLQSFRDKAVSHEKVTNEIADDIIRTCDPWLLEVTAEFNIRGGLQPTVNVRHEKLSS